MALTYSPPSVRRTREVRSDREDRKCRGGQPPEVVAGSQSKRPQFDGKLATYVPISWRGPRPRPRIFAVLMSFPTPVNTTPDPRGIRPDVPSLQESLLASYVVRAALSVSDSEKHHVLGHGLPHEGIPRTSRVPSWDIRAPSIPFIAARAPGMAGWGDPIDAEGGAGGRNGCIRPASAREGRPRVAQDGGGISSCLQMRIAVNSGISRWRGIEAFRPLAEFSQTECSPPSCTNPLL
jgi:hypothetical protein